MRVLQIIDETENEESLQFIINATRAVPLGLIDVDMYYRICRAVTDTLYEDLIFLQRNVFKGEPIKGEYSVHGLSRSCAAGFQFGGVLLILIGTVRVSI